MAKGPTKQHYVPQCYLREWVDPHTPTGQEPYVWIFNRGEKMGRKKAPANIFTESDLYTLKIEGQKNYAIEETLSGLEGQYASVFREKIKKHLPLTEEEQVVLCAFVSAMLQRTLRHKDNLERFYDELIEHAEAIEHAHGTPPTESEKLKHSKEDTHKMGVIQLLPDITELLLKMSVAFLCADGRSLFVTSDDPCNLFNPDLQWQRFYSPGLAQEHVQVTLPLSPGIMLCMSWSNLRGYMWWDNNHVEEANRMVVGHCYKYFISSDAKVKRAWFRNYPMNFLFIIKIIKHRVLSRLYKIRIWFNRYQYDRKRRNR